jgi:surface antigen
MRKPSRIVPFIVGTLLLWLPLHNLAAAPPWARGGNAGKHEHEKHYDRHDRDNDDEHWYAHKEKEHGHKHKVKRKYRGPKWVKGGPPPWAPAHGYRYRHVHHERQEVVVQETVVYTAPFDINLGNCNRAVLGSVLGGVAGGAIGSTIGKGSNRTAGIIGGTILGVLVGGAIGHHMDTLDQNCVGQALEHAPDHQTVEWKNPDTGGQYKVTPTEVYQDPQGQYCREYTATSTIGGKPQQVYGTACRQPDGSWKLIS